VIGILPSISFKWFTSVTFQKLCELAASFIFLFIHAYKSISKCWMPLNEKRAAASSK
jgi:hypothetical protein